MGRLDFPWTGLQLLREKVERPEFGRRWSLEGEGGQMTSVTIVREKEDRNWVWIETEVNPNRQPPDVTEG